MNNWSRKDFLKTSLLGGSAALFAGHGRLYGQAAPAAGSANGDVRVGCVGINAQGAGHMRDYVTGKIKGARLVAICDADEAVLNRRKADCEKEGGKVATYRDYRKMLESKEIDAIVIATPNHWHSLMTIWALQAGKDVYVEKPLSHNIWEGRQAVEAAKKYSKQIVQAGTQNRSSQDIKEAIAYIKSGKLGAIKWVRGTCYKPRDSIGLTTGPQAVPGTVDYDLWTGPADLTPPRRNGGKGPIHYDWHWFWNYGGGDISNQGIHQVDVARWMLGAEGMPTSVQSFGGRFGYRDDAETPNTLVSVFNYAKAPLIFEVRGLGRKKGMKAMDVYRTSSISVTVQCEGGYVAVSEAGTAGIYDADGKVMQKLAANTNGSHRQNFINAVQARKQSVANGLIENCHYSTALCHLGNISHRVGAEKSNAAIADAVKSSEASKEAYGRMVEHLSANEVDFATTPAMLGPLLKIDGAKELFTGSEKEIVAAANKSPLMKREGRGAFKVPQIGPKVVA
ncbi:MAG: hypothetical protein RL077_1614 [Verrucomicrobiota bacterium]|jgi:predicted dehydrogenase